jgi:hypothetical protein
LLRLCGPANEYKHNMSDETMSADAMLALATDHDAGVDIDSQPTGQTQNKNESASVEQDSSNERSASKEVDGGEQDDVGTSKSSETDSKAKQKEEKPKDQKSKFAQDQNRKTKTWEQINAEKEAIRAEREAVRREREEWSKQREQSSVADTNSFRDEKGYTAEDYEAAAKEFDADGDSQLAKAARAKADGVRKTVSVKQQQIQQERFTRTWADNFNKLSEKETWLKDQSSNEYKRTVELLQRIPILTTLPNGLAHAVELMKLQDTAGRSQSLESENKSLKEQLNKLQQKTAIGKSVPAGQLKAEEKDFSKLSQKEQRDALMRAAREFDREANQ